MIPLDEDLVRQKEMEGVWFTLFFLPTQLKIYPQAFKTHLHKCIIQNTIY